MKRSRCFTLMFIGVFLFFSCRKNDTVNVVFTIKYNSTQRTDNFRSYTIDDSKTRILFSNFKYIDGAGKEKLVKDVFLYKTNGNSSFSFTVPKGNYNAFKFSFGLDKSTNNSTPMSFAASNPLSVESGMYWDMLKYRFLIVEGMIDNSSTKDQTPNAPFSMHLGTDTMYAEIPVDGFPVGGSNIEIELDMKKLFALDADPFQISNFSNHSSLSEIPKGVAIKDSFVNAIKARVVTPL